MYRGMLKNMSHQKQEEWLLVKKMIRDTAYYYTLRSELKGQSNPWMLVDISKVTANIIATLSTKKTWPSYHFFVVAGIWYRASVALNYRLIQFPFPKVMVKSTHCKLSDCRVAGSLAAPKWADQLSTEGSGCPWQSMCSLITGGCSGEAAWLHNPWLWPWRECKHPGLPWGRAAFDKLNSTSRSPLNLELSLEVNGRTLGNRTRPEDRMVGITYQMKHTSEG